MDELDRQMARLSAAEEFFDLLGVPYEPSVMNVNRLHILKRFNQYLRRDGHGETLDLPARSAYLAEQLQHAYADFVNSTPAQEKVFKVFQDTQGQSISLDSLRAGLPAARVTAESAP